MKYLKFVLILIITAILCLSCNVRKEEIIVLDNTHPLALAPDVFWAVVIEPYAAYKDEIGWDSKGKKHCRKGEILQVLGKSTDENKSVWYYFENGWLPDNCLKIFDNRYKAESYSEKL